MNNSQQATSPAKQMTVLGFMSGTSLDGVDCAIITTDGYTISSFGASHFVPYSSEQQDILSQATQDALKWNFTGPRPNSLSRATDIVHAAHIRAGQEILQASKTKIDLIGFHGQTVLHRPPQTKNGKTINGQTLQLGDGQVLADALGIDTVFDFRSNDMKHGGHGAPLAPLYHRALVQSLPDYNPSETTAVLNIGGVSNVSLIRGDEVHASDCGPGNGPLDSYVVAKTGKLYDAGGKLSLSGTPNIALVEKWMGRQFFTKPVPKSADRWDFDVLVDVQNLSTEDACATLALFCAQAIANTLAQYNQEIDQIIICGGGRKNPAIMAALRETTNSKVQPAETVGWAGDDIEAQAFAYLAARSVRGFPLSLPATTGIKKPVRGGIFVRKI